MKEDNERKKMEGDKEGERKGFNEREKEIRSRKIEGARKSKKR